MGFDAIEINIVETIEGFVLKSNIHYFPAGLSSEARSNRKKKNIVSTKVNFIAWFSSYYQILHIWSPLFHYMSVNVSGE